MKHLVSCAPIRRMIRRIRTDSLGIQSRMPPRGLPMRLMLLLAFLTVAADTATAQTTMKTIPAPPDVAAAPADAAKTKSGLASRVIKAGTGKTHPGRTDLVTVHYTGWTTDGKTFDSSVARGEPAKFPLDRVIPGWTEGVQLMVTGETRRLWIPEPL